MSETYPSKEDYDTQDSHEGREGHDEPGLYEIRIKGHLDNRWAVSFEGLTFKLEDNGDTLLRGTVVDQAALHGLLRKVRDLGMTLLSVTAIRAGHADP